MFFKLRFPQIFDVYIQMTNEIELDDTMCLNLITNSLIQAK
jgi:hypothetical protein